MLPSLLLASSIRMETNLRWISLSQTCFILPNGLPQTACNKSKHLGIKASCMKVSQDEIQVVKKKIHLCETVRYPVIQHYTNKYCANSKSLRHWKLISAIQLLITYFTFDHWLLRSSKTWFGRPVSHTAWQITFACTKGQVLTSAQVSSFHILLLIQFSYVEHIQNVFSSCITAIVSSLPPRSW